MFNGTDLIISTIYYLEWCWTHNGMLNNYLFNELINTIFANFHLFLYIPIRIKYSKDRDHYYFSVKNEHGTWQLNNFKTTPSCFLCVSKIICSNMSKVLIFDWRKVYDFKSFGLSKKKNPENILSIFMK